jgi:branched-subunit amino acid transport protein
MNDPVAVISAMFVLAAGTYAFRFVGPALRNRISFPPRAVKLLETSSIVLLAALVVMTGLYEGHSFAGVARPAGVLVAGGLAWRKAPLLLVILASACTAAVLRLLGIP